MLDVSTNRRGSLTALKDAVISPERRNSRLPVNCSLHFLASTVLQITLHGEECGNYTVDTASINLFDRTGPRNQAFLGSQTLSMYMYVCILIGVV